MTERRGVPPKHHTRAVMRAVPKKTARDARCLCWRRRAVAEASPLIRTRGARPPTRKNLGHAPRNATTSSWQLVPGGADAHTTARVPTSSGDARSESAADSCGPDASSTEPAALRLQRPHPRTSPCVPGTAAGAPMDTATSGNMAAPAPGANVAAPAASTATVASLRTAGMWLSQVFLRRCRPASDVEWAAVRLCKHLQYLHAGPIRASANLQLALTGGSTAALGRAGPRQPGLGPPAALPGTGSSSLCLGRAGPALQVASRAGQGRRD